MINQEKETQFTHIRIERGNIIIDPTDIKRVLLGKTRPLNSTSWMNGQIACKTLLKKIDPEEIEIFNRIIFIKKYT